MSAMDDMRSRMEGLTDQVTGGNPKLVQSVVNMVQNTPGGVQGLFKEFQDKGLSGVVAALKGNAPKDNITPDKIEQGFGRERIDQLAKDSGVDRKEVPTQLANILPAVMQRLQGTA